MERDTYYLTPGLDMLGALNPNHPGPLFPEAVPVKPDLEPLLHRIPKDVMFQILNQVQLSHDENIKREHALEQPFRSL